MRKTHLNLKFAAVIVWLATTVSMAGWWLIYGLRQVDQFSAMHNELAQELFRKHRMLMWEGSFLIALLFGGGLWLIASVHKERRQFQEVKEFFARFTHDLKTSLASLRLQAELLEEDLKESAQEKVVKRLVKDTVRLELLLENSLLFAATETAQLHVEEISLKALVSSMSHHWPELEIHVTTECRLLADMRAAESIFKNLLQNAVVHGRATRVEIRAEESSDGQVLIRVHDNGCGFSGNVSQLGAMFIRHGSRSGSGIGLYLVKALTARLGGSLRFLPAEKTGFTVELNLLGRVA